MILSAYQPYFAPFPGFFEKALRSDVFVLLDTVQFPRGTSWLTRNRFKNDQGVLWVTVPVWRKGLGLQRINEVKICREGRWARKQLESLKTGYKRAPFFEEHLPFLERLFGEGHEHLVDLNVTVVRYLLKCLKIPVRLHLQSELDMDLNEPALSVALCRVMGADRFLVQNTARKFVKTEMLRKAGIRVEFFRPRVPVYPQLWGAFATNLSVLDLVFNCGPKARAYLE